MCRDARWRDESCGCHLREEHQSQDGEPLRNDDAYAKVAVWKHRGEGSEPELTTEELGFESVTPVQRSYA